MTRLSNRDRQALHDAYHQVTDDDLLRLLPLHYPADPILLRLQELEDTLAVELPRCVEAMLDALEEDAAESFGLARQEYSRLTALGINADGLGRRIGQILAASLPLTKEPEEATTTGIERLYSRLMEYIRWLGARFFESHWDDALRQQAEDRWPQLADTYPLGSIAANKGIFSHLERAPLEELLLDLARYKEAHEVLRFRARYERTTLSTISAHLQDGAPGSISARFINGLQETEDWAVDFAIPSLRRAKAAFDDDDARAFFDAALLHEHALEGKHMDTMGLFIGAIEALDGACDEAAKKPARELLPQNMSHYLRWMAARVFEEGGWGEADFRALGLRAAAAPLTWVTPDKSEGWFLSDSLSPRWLLEALDRRLAGHEGLMRGLRRSVEQHGLKESKALLSALAPSD